jgi:hypothetical protein
MTTEAAVDLSFRLFRRLFPLRPLDPSETPLSDEERRIYRRWEVWGLLPLFLVAPPLGYLWFLALKWGAGCFPQETPDTLFLLRPDPLIWSVPAMLLGIISSAIPISALYLALLGSRYHRFERFCSERVGFDGDRAFALLAVLFIVGTLVFFTVTVRSFARFTGSGVEIARAIPPGRTFYEYARVRSVEHRLSFRAPIGNTVREPHYVIAFDDGSAWYSNGVHSPPHEVAERIARMIAQRSGRTITELP